MALTITKFKAKQKEASWEIKIEIEGEDANLTAGDYECSVVFAQGRSSVSVSDSVTIPTSTD